MENYCIDLDGSLIKTDLFIESLWKYVKLNPFHFLLVLWWLRKGRCYVKYKLAKKVSVVAETLPYDHDIVAYLRELKSKGHGIYLVTGSNEMWAQKVAQHLKVFNMVMASSSKKNLVNHNKKKALEESFGKHQFYYMGNSRADYSVFSSAKGAITVGSQKFKTKVKKIAPIHRHFQREIFTFKSFFNAIRLKHWTKNLLIFFPLILFTDLTHLENLDKFYQSFLAFLSFSFLASTVYLLNDLLDLESDRENLLKKKRPFASGELTILTAFVALPTLTILSIILSCFLPEAFRGTLFIYFVATTLYSFYFKRIVGIDIIVLSSLYLMRLFAGSNAIDLPIPTYAYSICGLFFGSWALMKRYTEVHDLKYQNTKTVEGRGYHHQDKGVILATGIVFSLTSIVILSLMLIAPVNVMELSYPPLILFEIPLIFFLNFRLWILASREVLKTEPIVYILRDLTTYIILILMLLLFLFSKYCPY